MIFYSSFVTQMKLYTSKLNNFDLEIFMTDVEENLDAINAEKCAQLNDKLRKELPDCKSGKLILTPGLTTLPVQDMYRAIFAVRDFDSFVEGDDPYGERDFGAVDVNLFNNKALRVWFKIDYYDNSYEYHSPDVLDESLTNRVLTIYLPEEH